MSGRYPLSQPSESFQAGHKSLSGRHGTAMLLAKGNGYAQSFAPVALSDQVSENLRKTIVSNYELIDLAYFQRKEGSLEKSTNISHVCGKEAAPKTLRPLISAYDSSGELAETSRVRVMRSMLKSTGYVCRSSLGLADSKSFQLFGACSPCGSRVGVESLWAGRELDETDRQAF